MGSGIQGQDAFGDCSEPPRDENLGFPVAEKDKDLEVNLLSLPATRIGRGGRHSEGAFEMPTHAFVPVWNAPTKRRRLRKWLYDASPPPAEAAAKAPSLTGLSGTTEEVAEKASRAGKAHRRR